MSRVLEAGEKPGALWHIYDPNDADKIRLLLTQVLLLLLLLLLLPKFPPFPSQLGVLGSVVTLSPIKCEG